MNSTSEQKHLLNDERGSGKLPRIRLSSDPLGPWKESLAKVRRMAKNKSRRAKRVELLVIQAGQESRIGRINRRMNRRRWKK